MYIQLKVRGKKRVDISFDFAKFLIK